MLLYFYLGTTAYVWINEFKSNYDMKKRLKNEGYTFNGKKINGIGDILLGALYLGLLSIPVFNLMFPIVNRNKERNYDVYKNMMLEAGHINEPIEKEEKPVITVNDTKLTQRINREGHIYYSPMYRGEEDTLIEEKGKVYKKTL